MHTSSSISSTTTRFAVTIQHADRIVRNGSTSYVFYVVSDGYPEPLKYNRRYLLILPEKALNGDRNLALVALARPGQILGLEVGGLSVSEHGEIWFDYINEVFGLPLNESMLPEDESGRD